MIQLFKKYVLAFYQTIFPNIQQTIHDYYCDSVDLVDLERRMKEVSKGQAYFQKHGNLTHYS